MKKVFAVFLIAVLLFPCLSASALTVVPCIPDGYWESGYDFYLEIAGDTFLLRDYAKRIVLETTYTAEPQTDGSLFISLENAGLHESRMDYDYMVLSDIVYKDGGFSWKGSWAYLNRIDTYTLYPVENGPFADIIFLDEAAVAGLEGVWISTDNGWVLEYYDGLLSLYMSGYPDDPVLQENAYAVTYAWDESGGVVLIPEDLTRSDFGGFTFFSLEEGILTTRMIVYDADFDTSIRFTRVEPRDPSLIPPEITDPMMDYKPVIYLYPEKETEVSVALRIDGSLTCTYPAYNGGWHVTAVPDGTLTDANGIQYNYLYWEAETNAKWDMSRGFCVAGSDTAAFLEDALAELGLTRREANEFIVYWLPLMEINPYNLVSFQTERYTESAVLDISPVPDTLIRVFMAWQPLDAPVEIEPQKLSAPERAGFTAVEWGGAVVK